MIKTFNIRDENFNDHTIRVDEMTEHDADGNPTVVKNICFVISPVGDSVVFNCSPYTHVDMVVAYAKEWIVL